MTTGILDAGNHPKLPTAGPAGFDVDREDPLAAIGGHSVNSAEHYPGFRDRRAAE